MTPRVTAMLGPTNTGKTRLAMLACAAATPFPDMPGRRAAIRAFGVPARLLAAALWLAGCDRLNEDVYNCERATVRAEGLKEPLEPRSNFITFGNGHDYDGRTYVYGDGSRHRARVLPPDADDFLVKAVSGEAARVEAMCRAYGPGVLVVRAR